MDWGGPVFVLMIVAMVIFGRVAKTWIKATHGYPVEDECGGKDARGDLDAHRKAELLSGENERLRGQIGRLEERVAVLERIATEPGTRLSAEIDRLR